MDERPAKASPPIERHQIVSTIGNYGRDARDHVDVVWLVTPIQQIGLMSAWLQLTKGSAEFYAIDALGQEVRLIECTCDRLNGRHARLERTIPGPLSVLGP